MDYKQLWGKTLEKYSIIKELYIECEETDPELNTNLQPLNEFRAALDHIMKAATVICDESYNEQEKENFAWEQFDKLNSHLDRTFYDICDFLSINYRNKITDILEMGDSDVISKVYPDYYSKWKNQIEDISNRIIKYRFYKGMKQNNVQQSFEDYKKDVEVLRDIYIQIRKGITSLEEIIAEKK